MGHSNGECRLRKVYVFNMKGKPLLKIRQRIIYGRLAPLRRPVSARRLASMLGGLIDLRTINRSLKKLSDLNLVTKQKKGWVALQPPQDKESHFVRTRLTKDDRWHGCFASWKLPLPLTNPFPGRRNSTELYAAYWLIYNLEFMKKKCGTNLLAALLGVTHLTASRIVGRLREEKLLGKSSGKLVTLKHSWNLRYETDSDVPKKEDVLEDPLDILIKTKTGKEKIECLVDALEVNGIMTRTQIYDMVRDALKTHDPGLYPGDGSRLIIYRLEERLAGRTAIDSAAAARSNAGQREYDRRRLQQTRESLADRVLPCDRAMLEASLDGYTDVELDNADMALCGIGRRLTFAEVENVIRDPLVAIALKKTPSKPLATIDDSVVKDDSMEAMLAKCQDAINAPDVVRTFPPKPCTFVNDPELEAEISGLCDLADDD